MTASGFSAFFAHQTLLGHFYGLLIPLSLSLKKGAKSVPANFFVFYFKNKMKRFFVVPLGRQSKLKKERKSTLKVS